MWGAVFFLAVAGTAFADPLLVFPEQISRSGPRIVSGWAAEEGQFPHQLSLRLVSPAGAVTACGGSIISASWGLTAAHCTAGRVSVVIRAGTTNLTRPSAIFETNKYINHPLFNEALATTVQPNDIGLINFNRVLTVSDLIKPIRIQRSADMNKNYEGVQAIASGWGNTWTGGSSVEVLNWVYLQITSNQDCLDSYGGSAIIADSTICTRGYDDPTQSTCQGDSGGPLTIIDEDGELTMVGVTSFVSYLGCHAGVPSGFVRPGHYHNWFYEKTSINFDWDDITPTPETPAPDSEDTPDAPESEEATDAPVSEETTDAPDYEDTPDVPESEEATDAPVSEETTDAPDSEDTPDVPESEEATDAPLTEDPPTIEE